MAYDENRKPFLRLWCGFGCDYSVIGTKLVQNISESILYPSHIIMPSKARIIGNLTYYSETIKIKPAQKTTQEQKKLSRARRRNRVTLCIPNSTILMNVRMPSTEFVINFFHVHITPIMNAALPPYHKYKTLILLF